jgi:hypothetical protein
MCLSTSGRFRKHATLTTKGTEENTSFFFVPFVDNENIKSTYLNNKKYNLLSFPKISPLEIATNEKKQIKLPISWKNAVISRSSFQGYSG